MRKFVELDEYADSFEGGNNMSDLQLIFKLSSEIEEQCGSPAKELFELYAFNKTHADIPYGDKPSKRELFKLFMHSFFTSYSVTGTGGATLLAARWRHIAAAKGITGPFLKVMPLYPLYVASVIVAAAGVIATSNSDNASKVKNNVKKLATKPANVVKRLKKKFDSKRNA